MNEDLFWDAVQKRDTTYADAFVYAVRTTGIYCRPTCPSRRPYRQHVTFFSCADDAEKAGFRPCTRCHSTDANPPKLHHTLILAICRYLEQPHDHLPHWQNWAHTFISAPIIYNASSSEQWAYLRVSTPMHTVKHG